VKEKLAMQQRIPIAIGENQTVSALLQTAEQSRACYVFAHGAGAGMTHRFMEAVAQGFAKRGVATLRYQFLYMEQGGKRPDPPKLAHAAVRAAVAEATRCLPGVPLFAGGKSFGGRMTSQAQALAPLENVRGLIFFGFPLHGAGKPSDERATHLFDVKIPMLFLQGTRDELATLSLIEGVCAKLGRNANLRLFEGADHSFHVPRSSGRTDAEVLGEMLDLSAEWMAAQG
jgi:predicted alpha/beta-hydrolase family hydrolase